jgi:hypothetical protein
LNAEYQYLLEGFQDDWVDGVQRLLWVSKLAFWPVCV